MLKERERRHIDQAAPLAERSREGARPVLNAIIEEWYI